MFSPSCPTPNAHTLPLISYSMGAGTCSRIATGTMAVRLLIFLFAVIQQDRCASNEYNKGRINRVVLCVCCALNVSGAGTGERPLLIEHSAASVQ